MPHLFTIAFAALLIAALPADAAAQLPEDTQDESSIEECDDGRGTRANPRHYPAERYPVITNRTRIRQLLERSYPPFLRDAGTGGTTRVFLYVNREGVVLSRRVDESSGIPELDDAALLVTGGMTFEPARRGDCPVDVWVSFPITFEVRN